MQEHLKELEGFLTSLSQISRLSFEIHDEQGPVVSVSAPCTRKPDPSEIRDLSAEILRRGNNQRAFSCRQGALFGAPIWIGERVVGSLIAYDADPPGETKSSSEAEEGGRRVAQMESFLDQMARLLEEKCALQREIEEITDELSRSFEDLNLYARIAAQIRALRFSEAMLRNLMQEVLASMDADLAFAVLPQKTVRPVMVVRPGIADRVEDWDSFSEALLRSIPEKAPSLEENYFIVNHSQKTAVFRDLHPDPYRFLLVRVMYNQESYGWLGVVSFRFEEIFRQSELRVLTSMAEQLAAVIANTNLYRDLERFMINMVRSLVCAIEAKDVYTRGHSERVHGYCKRMADRLGLDEAQQESLLWASLLHDIGKIGIPERILNKPGKLTEKEFQRIKDHPKKGFVILKPLEPLSESMPSILHHHERYDGGGYPDGLKGEEIPLAARIIAVADTFDAMTSTRAYRSAKSVQEAVAIMDQVSGSQLDPRLVDVFKEIITKEKDVPSPCQDPTVERVG